MGSKCCCCCSSKDKNEGNQTQSGSNNQSNQTNLGAQEDKIKSDNHSNQTGFEPIKSGNSNNCIIVMDLLLFFQIYSIIFI